jgi:polyisoprenyl-teichoic acid--peptidoglycan teichoic acid transferase
MTNPKIDFLRKKYKLDSPRRKPFFVYGKILAAFLIFIAMFATALSYQVATTEDGGSTFSFVSTIKHLVRADDRELVGEKDDRVNFLLTGIGGEGHDGPQLTDTMIFASLRPSDGQIGMISIPRDLSVPIPGYGWYKINHANAYGEMDEPGSGPLLANMVVESILTQDIHYYVRVDFNGFAEFIDDLGGLDVYVERTFTDYEYPSHGMEYAECGEVITIDEEGEEVITENYECRYEVLHFDEGWTHMDGQTALKYVRSRHGNNGEASDFARSRRQQNVLLAVKNELFSASTILNPARLKNMLDTFEDNVSTNLSIWEILRLADQVEGLDSSQIVSHVLDSSPDSPLYAATVNGAYVLLPKNDDWSTIQAMAEHIFDTDADFEDLAHDLPDTTGISSYATVEIQNGTYITGLASRTSQLIDGIEFNVLEIGNAKTRGYLYTLIYDFTNGEKMEGLELLETAAVADITLNEDGWVIHNSDIKESDIDLLATNFEDLVSDAAVDFLIILGESASDQEDDTDTVPEDETLIEETTQTDTSEEDVLVEEITL